MTDYTELCSILRTKLHGTIKMEDGSIQLADIVAADVIEQLLSTIQQEREEHAETYKNLRSTYIKANEHEKAENSTLRNELCQKCGRYTDAHNGACNGCRWKVGNE